MCNIVGKKFMKITPVEVIDANDHRVTLLDTNKTHGTYTVSRDRFEKDYILGDDVFLNTKEIEKKDGK